MLVDHLLKTKNEYKNLKKQEIHNIFVNRNWTNLAFNMRTYGDFKDLYRRTASDKVLRDKEFNIA